MLAYDLLTPGAASSTEAGSGKLDRRLLSPSRSKRVERGKMLQRPNQVLVIDDDEAAREILVELLGRVGYHAFAAPEGRSGLEWLAGAAGPPPAVLLDLRMPGIGGVEGLRPYRAQGGLAPVMPLWPMDKRGR